MKVARKTRTTKVYAVNRQKRRVIKLNFLTENTSGQRDGFLPVMEVKECTCVR